MPRPFDPTSHLAITPPPLPPPKGIGSLYDCAAGSLDQAGTNFQRLAEATILRVPPELYLEQVCVCGGGGGRLLVVGGVGFWG